MWAEDLSEGKGCIEGLLDSKAPRSIAQLHTCWPDGSLAEAGREDRRKTSSAFSLAPFLRSRPILLELPELGRMSSRPLRSPDARDGTSNPLFSLRFCSSAIAGGAKLDLPALHQTLPRTLAFVLS